MKRTKGLSVFNDLRDRERYAKEHGYFCPVLNRKVNCSWIRDAPNGPYCKYCLEEMNHGLTEQQRQFKEYIGYGGLYFCSKCGREMFDAANDPGSKCKEFVYRRRNQASLDDFILPGSNPGAGRCGAPLLTPESHTAVGKEKRRNASARVS